MKDVILKAGEIKRQNIPFYLDGKEFYAFVERLTNKRYADAIAVRQIRSESGMDEYRLFDEGEKIIIEATSGSAAGVCFNYYLKNICGVYRGFITDSGVLPEVPPKIGKTIERKSLYHYRYFLNYCTFGYSFTYYSWEDWEKVLDRMILSGYNLVLNAVGQECVWREVLMQLGYDEDAVAKFLVGAPFMPWLNMMNMSDYYGKYPENWWNDRVALSNKISERLNAFGVGVMLPGYSGMVPDDFKKRFKDSTVKLQGDWCGYDRPGYLIFSDPLFDKVADIFYQTQKRLIGKNVRYFSSDPFHEGGITEGIDLTAFAEKAFAAMKRCDENAVWCFQGWGENPRREMLLGIPAERTLVCNLLADTNANAGDDYLERPWLYCTVNNFGGQHLLRGGLINSLTKPYNFINLQKYTMVGIGLMPEAVENGEVFFDIIAETSVSDVAPDLDEFLTAFIKARYGIVNDTLKAAWKALAESVYIKDDICTSFESSVIARPSMTANMVSAFANPAEDLYPEAVVFAAENMLKNYECCKNSSAFIFDLADTARQAAANFGWHLVYGLQRAVGEKDITSFEKNAKIFESILDLQDKICSSHKKLLFANYLYYPENYDRANAEYNTYLARRLITVWGDERTHYRLNDYAAREYGGLIKDYYAPRWKRFIDTARSWIENGKEAEDVDFYSAAEAFTREKKKYPTIVRNDLDETVKEILQIIKSNKF